MRKVTLSTSYLRFNIILDPVGGILAKSLGKEEMLIAELSPEILQSERGRMRSFTWLHML
ncbi:MAG: hypothetical protein OK457_01900 [Thaumarchaeota archaeon]|nr:hypothetical protein [Nitrososphaerota archaeon]